MTELSPAVQAVFDAALGVPVADHIALSTSQALRLEIAAALRALEEQLAADKAPPMERDLEIAVLTERIRLFRIILAIATELKNHQ